MTYHLDIRTISAITSFVGIMMGIIMLYVYQSRKTYPGFKQWMYASLLYCLGMLLLSTRGLFPDLVTIIFANTCIALYFVMVTYGIELFLVRKIRVWIYIAPMVVLVLSFFYFTYVSPDVSVRIIIISTLAFLFSAIGAYRVHVNSPEIINGRNNLVVLALFVQAGYMLFRIFYTLLLEMGIRDFMSSSSVQAFTFMMLIGCNILIFLSLIIFNSQKVELELQEAITEIKTLEGILPLCMHCKQIRDDKGYWNQLEAYISKHTEAQFSHSICDKCLEEHYPELKSD